MPKFRKRPVVIDAVRFEGAVPDKPPSWLRDALDAGRVKFLEDGGSPTAPAPALCIHTLEGFMYADPGDWIVRGVKGEMYPCKPDIFAATYEPA